jgi:hypothetical protein
MLAMRCYFQAGVDGFGRRAELSLPYRYLPCLGLTHHVHDASLSSHSESLSRALPLHTTLLRAQL